MKTENLIDAIGLIDEKYVADAHQPCVKIRHRGLKRFAIAAAAMLCIAVPLPAMTAFGVDEAYNLLYMAMPSVAQAFKPVQESCEDNGVRMEVISASIEDDKASFYISMQSDEIDKTVDLYDSYNINCPFDNVGHVSFSKFDENTNTAYFMVNIETMNGEKIPKGKVTFSVRELIFNKHEFDGAINGINLSEVPENPPTMDDINCGEYGINSEYIYVDYYEELSKKYLVPTVRQEITNGISLTGIGWIDGELHIQTYYEKNLKTDNHGYVYLVDENGEKIESYASVSLSDNEDKGNYKEALFSVDYDELENYSLWGEFWTSNGYKSGDWEVTFRIK